MHGPPRFFMLSTGWLADQAPYTNKYDWMKVYYEHARARRGLPSHAGLFLSLRPRRHERSPEVIDRTFLPREVPWIV